MMIRGVIFSAALLVASPVRAEETGTPTKIADAFFESVVAGKLEPAFAQLMSHARFDETKPLETKNALGQISQAMSLYGQPNGYEQISNVRSGESITRLIYITKHDALPLVWQLNFYRSAKGWELLTILFNDQLQGLP